MGDPPPPSDLDRNKISRQWAAITTSMANGERVHLHASVLETIIALAKTRDIALPSRGLEFRFVIVDGFLDLEGLEFPIPLMFESCEMRDGVNLDGSRIRMLSASGCALSTLTLRGAYIDGPLLLNAAVNGSPTTISSAMSLRGTRIEGPVDLSTLCVGDGALAIEADEMVAEGAFLARALKASGVVRMVRARIQSELDFSGSEISIAANDKGTAEGLPFALSLDRSTIDGSLRLINVQFESGVRLVGTRIGADIVLDGASLGIASPKNVTWLAEGLQVEGALHWYGLAARPLGLVVLARAKVREFIDDIRSRPLKGNLILGNFSCEIFSTTGAPPKDSVMDRLGWIALQPEGPQSHRFAPYEMYRRILEAAGLERDAIRVAVVKHRAILKHADLGVFARLGKWLFGLTTDFGYRTSKILAIYVPLVLLGGWFYSESFEYGGLVPKPQAKVTFDVENPQTCPPEHTCIVPYAYALDVSVPFIDFGQTSNWQPRFATRRIGPLTQVFYWVNLIIGWFLAGAAAASLSGLFRR